MEQTQKLNAENKEHVMLGANDYKPSSGNDQIPVDWSRKTVINNLCNDNTESQNSHHNNYSPKTSNPEVANEDIEISSRVSCQLSHLSGSLENQNEQSDYSYQRDCDYNKIQVQNTEGEHQFQNSKQKADNQIENRRHDSASIQAMEMKQPASREFKNINCYTIESDLKKFTIKNLIIEKRVKEKIDEWICCFTQNMEDTLNQVLQKCRVFDTPGPLWNLQEAIDYTKEMFNDNNTIKMITEKLSALLFANCSSKCGIKTIIPPNVFMRMIGCSILLVKSLKNVMPDTPEILDGEKNLEMLLHCIENVSETEAPLPVPRSVESQSELDQPMKRKQICKL